MRSYNPALRAHNYYRVSSPNNCQPQDLPYFSQRHLYQPKGRLSKKLSGSSSSSSVSLTLTCCSNSKKPPQKSPEYQAKLEWHNLEVLSSSLSTSTLSAKSQNYNKQRTLIIKQENNNQREIQDRRQEMNKNNVKIQANSQNDMSVNTSERKLRSNKDHNIKHQSMKKVEKVDIKGQEQEPINTRSKIVSNERVKKPVIQECPQGCLVDCPCCGKKINKLCFHCKHVYCNPSNCHRKKKQRLNHRMLVRMRSSRYKDLKEKDKLDEKEIRKKFRIYPVDEKSPDKNFSEEESSLSESSECVSPPPKKRETRARKKPEIKYRHRRMSTDSSSDSSGKPEKKIKLNKAIYESDD